MKTRNSEPYIATHLHRKGRQLGLPIGGNFELTARCNFNCPMCYVHLKKEDIDAQGKELTAQQWIDIAQHAKDQGMVFVLLTGGEPFVREDFFEIYDAMKEMGLMIAINTNGSMLNGEIRRRLIENPPFRINVSLYGGCTETYKNMCGQEAFNTVVENIRAIKEAGIDIRVNLSITQYNQQDLEKIYHISQDLGVHVKASSYMYPSIRVNGGKYGYGNRLSPLEAAHCSVRWDQLRFTSDEFAIRARNMKEFITVDETDCTADLLEGVACRAGSSAFWLTWDGRMLPCGMMPYPEAYPMKIGFEAAWDLIKKETAAIRIPSQCTSCPKRPVCPVCAAVCITETGRFDGVPDYVCKKTEETIRATWKAYQEKENED